MDKEKEIIKPTIPLTPDNIFDNIDQLRLSQNFTNGIGVEKVLTNVPVKKPGKQTFFRINPSSDYTLETIIFEDQESKENFIVTPSLRDELLLESKPKIIFTVVDRYGNLTLWPANLPNVNGQTNSWTESALAAAELSKKSWIRISSNMSIGAYEIYRAKGDLPDPEWPEISFKEILELGFKDKVIDNLDHPVVKKLRGEL